MNLVKNMMQSCCFMEKTRVPDGAGGFTTTWVEGAEFDAAIVMDSTMQAKIAEKQGVTSVYTVTVFRSTPLEYHDVIKRLNDGRIFRITSEGMDKESPAVSSLDMRQASAEKWELAQ